MGIGRSMIHALMHACRMNMECLSLVCEFSLTRKCGVSTVVAHSQRTDSQNPGSRSFSRIFFRMASEPCTTHCRFVAYTNRGIP